MLLKKEKENIREKLFPFTFCGSFVNVAFSRIFLSLKRKLNFFVVCLFICFCPDLRKLDFGSSLEKKTKSCFRFFLLIIYLKNFFHKIFLFLVLFWNLYLIIFLPFLNPAMFIASQDLASKIHPIKSIAHAKIQK